MARYLISSEKKLVRDDNGAVAIGWVVTFYNDHTGKIEKILATEDDTIVRAEPETTQASVQEQLSNNALQP